MKVLFVFQSDFNSPGEKLFFYLANELARCGHESLVLVNGDTATIQIMSQEPAFTYCRLAFKGTRLAPDLFARIARFQPDIIHAQYIRNEPFRAGIEVKQRLGIPLVVHHDDAEEAIFQMRFTRWWESPLSWGRIMAGTWIHPRWWHWYNPFLKRFEPGIDAHDCLSEALKEDLHQRCGWQTDHLVLGIDVEYFRLAPEPDKSRLPRGVAQDDFIVMYNGALHRYTWPDFEMLLDAIAIARRKIPHLRLVYSGSNFKRAKVEAGIAQRGLQDCVTSLGLVPTMRELRDHFAYADVFVQPGKDTRFNELRLPSKLMFYLAAGRPIVTLDFGFGRVLRHKADAFLFREYSPGAIAEALLCLRDNPALGRDLAKNAQITARRLFEVKTTTQQYVALYARVLAGHRRA